MALDPQTAWVLERARESGRPDLWTLTPEAARAEFEVMVAILDAKDVPIHRWEDRRIPGPAGPLGIRLYWPRQPAAGEALPVLVFLHGGGWVIGSLESHDPPCRILANEADCMVVSVDYRLAPEHKFPAALEDCFAALSWVAENARALGADPARIAVGGDSAGGNLAAACCQLARAQGGPPLVFQLLIYPATDLSRGADAESALGSDYLLTRELIEWFVNHVLARPEDASDPRASPLLAPDLGGLPPALVITAGFDPMCRQGHDYAERLRAAGVAVEYHCYEGQIHGFVSMSGVLDDGRDALARSARALARAFTSGGGADS